MTDIHRREPARRKLCFVTQNPHKVEEVRRMVGGALEGFEIMGPETLGHCGEIPETGNTFAQNACQKADFIHRKYGVDCFADDSGLEVEALGGQPGVHSARFAGPQKNDADNLALLMEKMRGQKNRQAAFVTVMAVILAGKSHVFEGRVSGYVAAAARGTGGFGYDPVFVPEGERRTFAEMAPEEKNADSHRARAMRRVIEFLGHYSENP